MPGLSHCFCFSLLTPIGGGIPHGVFSKMGPGGNACPLTEHEPRWTDKHETVQPSPFTVERHNKPQADTESGEGVRVAGSWSVDQNPLSESGSVSEFLTDKISAVHFETVIQIQDQTAVVDKKPGGARKFTVEGPGK